MNWRYIGVIGVLVMLLVAMTWLSSQVSETSRGGQEVITNRAIYNARPSGYKAWYHVMDNIGVPVSIWRQPIGDLETVTQPSTMLMVEPYTAVGRQLVFAGSDAKKLMAWVTAGNTLILVDDFQRTGAKAVLKQLHLQVKQPPVNEKDDDQNRDDANEPAPRVFYPLTVADNQPMLARHIDRPILTETRRWFTPAKKLKTPFTVLIQDDKDRPVAVRLPVGKGRVVLFSAVDIADNSFLQDPKIDNYQLMANLMVVHLNNVAGQDSTGWINEYVHGYGYFQDLLSYYHQKTPLGHMLTQLLLLFMVVLWLSFSAWRPKRKTLGRDAHTQNTRAQNTRARNKGVDLLPFIDSLGGIYYRKKAAAVSLAPVLADIEQQLRKRYRVDVDQTARVTEIVSNLLHYQSLPPVARSWVTADRDKISGEQQALGPLLAPVLATALAQARDVVRENKSLPPAAMLTLSQQLMLIQDMCHNGPRRAQSNRVRRRRKTGANPR